MYDVYVYISRRSRVRIPCDHVIIKIIKFYFHLYIFIFIYPTIKNTNQQKLCLSTLHRHITHSGVHGLNHRVVRRNVPLYPRQQLLPSFPSTTH